MHNEYTIEVDQQEKRGWTLLFPENLQVLDPAHLPTKKRTRTVKLNVERTHLPTADYRLKEAPRGVLIERKGSLQEVATNCLTTVGRRRFAAECQRLRAECDAPFVLLEGSHPDLLRPTSFNKTPELALDALLRLLWEWGIQMLVLPRNTEPQRRALGVWVAHLLITGDVAHAAPQIH